MKHACLMRRVLMLSSAVVAAYFFSSIHTGPIVVFSVVIVAGVQQSNGWGMVEVLGSETLLGKYSVAVKNTIEV